jgi:alpha-beta hydrolase superfamily lysophospholipase
MKHKESKFKGYKDIDIYYQCWLPDDTTKAVLLIAHGLAEHSGRYMNLVNYFVPKGYAIWALDYRGHGKSEGKRSYVERFDEYHTDLKTFFDIVRKESGKQKIFIVGHSMGTIVVPYAIEHQKELAGLILSGPAVIETTTVSPILIALAGVISAILPKMGVTVIDASTISRDPAVIDAYVNDPLVFRGKIPARTGYQLVKMWRTLPEQMHRIELPILIMHGSADRLSPLEGSKLLYERISSKDKTLKIYDE